MGIALDTDETHELIVRNLIHRVDVHGESEFIEAMEWCMDTMGQQFVVYVSGGVIGKPYYLIRQSARWVFWQNMFWFACRGDATYIKLKWGGQDHNE